MDEYVIKTPKSLAFLHTNNCQLENAIHKMIFLKAIKILWYPGIYLTKMGYTFKGGNYTLLFKNNEELNKGETFTFINNTLEFTK